MITRAMLMVSHPDVALEKVGRDTVLERQIKTAYQAGIEEIWIGGHKPETFPSKPLPTKLTLYWISSSAAPQKDCLTPYAALSDQHLIDAETLEKIIGQPYADPISFTDEKGRMVVQIMTPPQREFHYPETSPLPLDSYILLERPFSSKGILAWVKSHALTTAKNSSGIFKRILGFLGPRKDLGL